MGIEGITSGNSELYAVVQHLAEIRHPCGSPRRTALVLMRSRGTESPLVNETLWGEEATVQNARSPLKLFTYSITFMNVAMAGLT